MVKGYMSDAEARMREKPHLGLRATAIENKRAARSVVKYMEDELRRQMKKQIDQQERLP